MNLIRFALRKPISILVMVAGLFFFGIGAIKDIKVDILPKMNLPVITSRTLLEVIRQTKWRLILLRLMSTFYPLQTV